MCKKKIGSRGIWNVTSNDLGFILETEGSPSCLVLTAQVKAQGKSGLAI